MKFAVRRVVTGAPVSVDIASSVPFVLTVDDEVDHPDRSLAGAVDVVAVPAFDVDRERGLIDALHTESLHAVLTTWVDLPDVHAVRAEVNDAPGDVLW